MLHVFQPAQTQSGGCRNQQTRQPQIVQARQIPGLSQTGLMARELEARGFPHRPAVDGIDGLHLSLAASARVAVRYTLRHVRVDNARSNESCFWTLVRSPSSEKLEKVPGFVVQQASSVVQVSLSTKQYSFASGASRVDNGRNSGQRLSVCFCIVTARLPDLSRSLVLDLRCK